MTDLLSQTQRALEVRQVTYPETDLTDALLLPGKSRYWTDHRGREITGLRPIQSRALHAIRDAGGGFLALAVGAGKALCAGLAGTVLDKELAIIFAPASTVPQLRATLAEWGQHFRLPRYRVESYAQLSRIRETNLLRDLIGDLHPSKVVIVCDEMHRLRYLTSARTMRIIRVFQECDVEPEDWEPSNGYYGLAFVGLSGTITSSGLRDFYHLLALALRENCPMPLDAHKHSGGHLHAWAEVIDDKGRPEASHWRMVYPLMEAFGGGEEWPKLAKDRRDYARRAFQKRLETAPGVVCTKKTALAASLNIGVIDLEVPEEVKAALDGVNLTDTLPNGDPIVDDITKWRAQRQISAGFSYYWDWPDGIVDWDWLDAKRNWDTHVRQELAKNSADGYDSPGLVERRVAGYVIDNGWGDSHLDELGFVMCAWHAQKYKKPPPVVPLWISDYLVRDVVGWLSRKREPVLVWYESNAIAEKLAEHMPVYGAGDGAPDKVETCAVSIRAQGEGLNLDDWRVSLVIEPPSGGHVWEQLLGRTHRPGQQADEVEAWVYGHTAAYRKALETAQRRAWYIQNTTGNQQKLCYATWL